MRAKIMTSQKNRLETTLDGNKGEDGKIGSAVLIEKAYTVTHTKTHYCKIKSFFALLRILNHKKVSVTEYMKSEGKLLKKYL